MEPNYEKLAFSRAWTDLENGFITPDVCHNYSIMSGCDEGCPALLSGDCEEWEEALKNCLLTSNKRKELIELYKKEKEDDA